ncbi:MAG: NAD(+) diphosphatase [Acidimicrobiia bacterium]
MPTPTPQRFLPLLDVPDPLAPGLVVVVGHDELSLVEGLAPSGEDVHVVGMLDDRPVWAVPATAPVEGSVGLRSLWGSVDDVTWTVAGRAVQLVEWDRTHRFCGRCGGPTELVPGERCRTCPTCGLSAFPRLSPAVIVLVGRDDGRVLLAHGRSFPVPMYSCLAGFVEPGETLEEAAHREIAEEVGIEIDDLRYWGSQPWPFPHSLMVGFTARYAGGELSLEEAEIVDAGWYQRDRLPRVPPPGSIARSMIDDWRDMSSAFPGHPGRS